MIYLLGINFDLPKEDDITRDQAFANAQKAILDSEGWTVEKLSLYGTREAYRTDISNQSEYYFVFTYRTSAITSQQQERATVLFSNGEIPHKIIVRIEAKEGAIIEVRENNDPVASGM